MITKTYKQRLKFVNKNYFLKLHKTYKKITLFKKWFDLNKAISKRQFFHKITIHVKPNNIFYTLINIYTNKIISHSNTGMLQVKTTKKHLKQNIIRTMFLFFKKIYRILKKTIIINIIAPKNLKRRILKQLNSLFLTRQKQILINFVNKKCFNGCRPPKKQRKKHKYNILLKS